MKKNFWWGVLWTTLAVFASDFLIHQVFMKGAYADGSGMWRANDWSNTWATMVMGGLMVGFFIFWIYSIGYKGKGWGEAWRFALYFGCFQAGKTFMMYSIAPYSWNLVWAWVFWGFVQMWILGLVATWSIKTWKIQPWSWGN